MWVVFGSVNSHFLRTECFKTPNLPFVDAKHTRTRPEQDPNETPTKPPEISNLCVMVCELVQECATPCKPMQGYLDFCKGFRVKVLKGRVL